MALKNTWVVTETFTHTDANNVANAVNKATSGVGASVTTSETTTSTSYADLTTTTDSVTVTIGPSGQALVHLYGSYNNNSGTNNGVWIAFDVSGANTIAPSDAMSLQGNGFGAPAQAGATFFLTGLSTGITTFKMKYKVQGNTGTFAFRRIAVIPL